MAILGVTHDTVVTPVAGGLTSGVLVTTTGDKWAFTPSMPCRIIRWGIIWDVAPTVTPPVLELDFRPVAGSNTNRVSGAVVSGIDTAGGTITSPAIGAAGTNQGQGLSHDVRAANISASGLDGFVLFPGNQAILNVTTAASAGSGFPFIEYENLTFQGDPKTPGVGTQTTTVNQIVNITRVAS